MAFLTQKPRVAIMLRGSAKTYREILRGILRFTNQTSAWTVLINQSCEKSADEKRLQFDRLAVEGIIIDETNPLFQKFSKSKRTPVISVQNTCAKTRTGHQRIRLYCDNAAIGRFAADYFLKNGFTSFAYVPDKLRLRWSFDRGDAFGSQLKASGFTCAHFVSSRRSIHDDQHALSDWLKGLPRPTAVFVANDARAREVLDVCLRTGISVPSEIALLGCDDDELICETAIPQLSSIRFSTETAGYQAARLLDRLIKGKADMPQAQRDISYGPSSIIARSSSDKLVSTDKLIELALTYIQLNALSGLKTSDLARHLHISRRLLETRFRTATGMTIGAKIMSIRLEKAYGLLKEGVLSIADIAENCGFPNTSHFGVMFKRHFNRTPSSLRKY